MAARHVSALLVLGISASAATFVSPSALMAEEDTVLTVPQEKNARHQFVGRVTTNSIPVRSGPSNNFYPTMKLDKDARVTVVGIKYDWLKIVPPQGSFSYVPQAYVTRRNDGKIGRVNSTLNVRAGSSLNAIKTTVQAQLTEGQDVTILGEQDEYYKIAPPEGAYVFINKQYVEPLEKVPGGSEAEIAKSGLEPAPGASDATKPVEPPVANGDAPAVTTTPEIADGTPAPSPDTQPSAVAEAATQPAPAVAEDFRALEADFETASKQPVVDQPIESLAARYTTLANSGTLSGVTKRVVDARLLALKMRGDARGELLAFRESQKKMEGRRQALEAEKSEIDERLKQTQVSLYTAVGTLRVSSIQQGNQTLYRLADPATGRTMVYIRSNDPKYAGMLNQFVGVRGDLTSDERLKMKSITPTEAEVVDASKVNSTVIATITPPSLLPTATVDTNEPGN